MKMLTGNYHSIVLTVSDEDVVSSVTVDADVSDDDAVVTAVSVAVSEVFSEETTASVGQNSEKFTVIFGDETAIEVITPSPSKTAFIPSALYTQPPFSPDVSSAPLSRSRAILSRAEKSAETGDLSDTFSAVTPIESSPRDDERSPSQELSFIPEIVSGEVISISQKPFPRRFTVPEKANSHSSLLSLPGGIIPAVMSHLQVYPPSSFGCGAPVRSVTEQAV